MEGKGGVGSATKEGWNEENFEQANKTCMNQKEKKVMRLQKWTSGSASDYDIWEGTEVDGCKTAAQQSVAGTK